MIKTMLPKDDQSLPDSYSVKITYVTGKNEMFEIAHHKIIKDTATFELATTDDIWILLPLSNIVKIEFDKQFSKIVEIKKKQDAKKDS